MWERWELNLHFLCQKRRRHLSRRLQVRMEEQIRHKNETHLIVSECVWSRNREKRLNFTAMNKLVLAAMFVQETRSWKKKNKEQTNTHQNEHAFQFLFRVSIGRITNIICSHITVSLSLFTNSLHCTHLHARIPLSPYPRRHTQRRATRRSPAHCGTYPAKTR